MLIFIPDEIEIVGSHKVRYCRAKTCEQYLTYNWAAEMMHRLKRSRAGSVGMLCRGVVPTAQSIPLCRAVVLPASNGLVHPSLPFRYLCRFEKLNRFPPNRHNFIIDSKMFSFFASYSSSPYHHLSFLRNFLRSIE